MVPFALCVDMDVEATELVLFWLVEDGATLVLFWLTEDVTALVLFADDEPEAESGDKLVPVEVTFIDEDAPGVTRGETDEALLEDIALETPV